MTTTSTRFDFLGTERQTSVLEAARMSMTEIVSILASNLDHTLLDKTGLTGLYQFNIELPPTAAATRSALALGTPLTAGVSVSKVVKGSA